ncbi:MAG: pilus assembly protein PilO [Oscillatoriales cyanobacterium RM2_1_1]|nr:pilus assembly protein PilO [Oscillatoriales cyanobacterium SM2_3_0]NJO44248.1 pilus assembly protein PilO [Oscillatoriales cyanobacterium RM2_1_1]
MTAANEFIEADEEFEASGPSIFGITFTPRNLGILLGILGGLLALFGLFKLVIPALSRGGELKAGIETKQQEIKDQDERLSKKAEAEAQLAQANQRRADVTTLFASEETLDTLLFDVEEQLNQRVNANITDPNKRAQITKLEPVPVADPGQEIINDGSLGPGVNGKLRRRQYKVEFEGSFPQTRQFMVILERMQPMLLTRNVKTELTEGGSIIEGEYKQGRFVESADQPQRRVKTSFDLEALMPLSQAQLDAAAAAAQPVPADGQPAPDQPAQ